MSLVLCAVSGASVAKAQSLQVLEVYGSTRGWQNPSVGFVYLSTRDDVYPGVSTGQVDCPIGYKPLSCTGHCWDGILSSVWTYSFDEDYLPTADYRRGGYCRVSCKRTNVASENDMEIQVNCVPGVQINRVGFATSGGGLPFYGQHPSEIPTPVPTYVPHGGAVGSVGSGTVPAQTSQFPTRKDDLE